MDIGLKFTLQCVECSVSPTRLLAVPVSVPTSVYVGIPSQVCLIFNPEDLGIRVLRNVGMNLPNYAASYTLRPSCYDVLPQGFRSPNSAQNTVMFVSREKGKGRTGPETLLFL